MAKSDNLKLLASWLVGEFSTKEPTPKSKKPVPAHLLVVPIWANPDGYWLYLAHAAVDDLDNPHQQDVFMVRDVNNELLEIELYVIDRPDKVKLSARKKWTGTLTKDDITFRQGCSMILRRDGLSFAGATLGEGCISVVDDMMYTTAQIVVNQEDFRVWVRRFSRSAGKKVTGKTIGGQTYKKVKTFKLQDAK